MVFCAVTQASLKVYIITMECFSLIQNLMIVQNETNVQGDEPIKLIITQSHISNVQEGF